MGKGSPKVMTMDEVRAHQQRHGLHTPGLELGPTQAVIEEGASLFEPRKKSGPEIEYELILESMKQAGKIVEHRYEGIKLAWGTDPRSGRPMIYTPDFYVVRAAFRQKLYIADILLVEVKGSKIWPKDMIRFKGCRAEWPMFDFEMHQRGRDGAWTRIQ